MGCKVGVGVNVARIIRNKNLPNSPRGLHRTNLSLIAACSSGVGSGGGGAGYPFGNNIRLAVRTMCMVNDFENDLMSKYGRRLSMINMGHERGRIQGLN
jgi:hypothetical protein